MNSIAILSSILGPISSTKLPDMISNLEIDELEGLSNRELLRKASREMLIAIGLVSEVLPSELPHLMATKTMETATLFNALTAGLRAAVDGLEQFHCLPGQAGHAVRDQQ